MKKIIVTLLILFICGYYIGSKYQNLKATYHCGPPYFVSNINHKIESWFKENVFRKKVESLSMYDCFFDKSKEIKLQRVNNLGYTFYVGQIDYPNSPDISDDIKNQITKTVDNIKFPKTILTKIPIVIVNSLAVEKGQYISHPNSNRLLDVSIFDSSFLSRGGVYTTYNGSEAVIYINKTIIDKKLLSESLVHEFGHAIASTITSKELDIYYQLRNIPAKTEQYGKIWNKSPQEDFAEVYRSIFTGSNVQTIYGPVSSQTKSFVTEIVNKLNSK
jgi:hypothetical protein